MNSPPTQDTSHWAIGALIVLLISSLACGIGGAEPDTLDEDQSKGIPDHPTARRMVDGVMPFAVHDKVESSRVVAATGLLASVTMLPDNRVALVFPPKDRQGFDLAIGGVDHPWDRRPISDTPVDDVGHITAVAGLDGTVWTLIRQKSTPQALELIRWSEDGADDEQVEREQIERPAPSTASPLNDRCPDVALGLSPQGTIDVAFRQNGAGGQTEIHHAHRTISGQWEHKLIAEAGDALFDFRYPPETGQRTIGCQLALDYDDFGLPQVLTTVEVAEPGGVALHSAGFLVGGDGRWYPSGTKYFKDGRIQWAGPLWHNDVDYGVDLRQGRHGFLFDGPKIHAGDPDDRSTRLEALVGLNTLRVDLGIAQDVYSTFHENRRNITLDVAYSFAEDHAYGVRILPDGGVCIPRNPEQWAGVNCTPANMAELGQNTAPFWRHDDLEMRSPIFTRGPVDTHAAFCLTRDGRLAACSGGHAATSHYRTPAIDEPAYIVESSVDSGVLATGSQLTVKLNYPPSDIGRIEGNFYKLTYNATQSTWQVSAVAHNDRFILTGVGRHGPVEQPFRPYEVYRMELFVYDTTGELISAMPWQYTDNPGITRTFRVSDGGELYHLDDPRSGELVIFCDTENGGNGGNVFDDDGVCRRESAVSPLADEELLLPVAFDGRTANGELPKLYDQEDNEVPDFAPDDAYDAPWWQYVKWDVELEGGHAYEFVLPAGVHDGLGNELSDEERRYRFETELKSFRLLGTTPSAGATDVALDAPIYIFFNDSVAPPSEGTPLIVLRSEAGTVPISFARGGQTEQGWALIAQHPTLEPNTLYHFELHEYLRGESPVVGDGYLEGAPHTISFTTGDGA